MRHFIPTLILAFSTISCVTTETLKQEAVPQNIIMVIGDGMGPAYTTAYRYFSDNPKTETIEETVFDRHLIGSSSTNPAAISGVVTDSAASATALATGVKSYNGAIGVDVNKNSVQSVLEWAKLKGKTTGIVVTSQINHATPASYLTHNESRRNYNAIADSYIDDGIKADLYLGGGWQYFIREDRNIVNEFKQAGFHYLDNYQGLTNLPNNKPILGLFADTGLPWALDDTNKHRLSAMTKAGIQHLMDYQNTSANKQGFFMLIEASQIDWAGHVNDVSNAMAEMDDLAKTLEYLEHFVKQNPNTLVIVTADHSTGGLTIGAKGKYEWQPEKLRSMKHSPTYIAKQLLTNKITSNFADMLFNFELSDDDIAKLIQSKNTAVLNKNSTHIKKLKSTSSVEFSLTLTIKQIIDKYSNTGWTTSGHTAIDVPVFAFGERSELFSGHQDNTEIAKKIFLLLGK